MDGRLNDIPYLISPPLLFTYRQTAPLAAGSYTFTAGTKTPFTPSRPILPNVLYMFETLDFAMDIAEADYFGAITTLPEFSSYVQSDASSPAFREPIPLSKYFVTVPYKLAIMGSELLGESYRGGDGGVSSPQGFTFNRLLGNVNGVLFQTPSLIGKVSVTAIIVLSAQEISEACFVSQFKARAEGGGKSNQGHHYGQVRHF